MHDKLLAGAAVIDVPEPGFAFMIETHDGYAVDCGTPFAVRVDQRTKQSDFEIIEGEIAVRHPLTGNEVRLSGQGKTATISEQSLVVIDPEAREDTAENKSSNLLRARTNGRADSALRYEKRKNFRNREIPTVKRTNNGRRDHRSFSPSILPRSN